MNNAGVTIIDFIVYVCSSESIPSTYSFNPIPRLGDNGQCSSSTKDCALLGALHSTANSPRWEFRYQAFEARKYTLVEAEIKLSRLNFEYYAVPMSLLFVSRLKLEYRLCLVRNHSRPESGSSSRSSESHVFTMHQTMRVVTIPAAVPTLRQIVLDMFWKLNINKATKNPHALFKRISDLKRV